MQAMQQLAKQAAEERTRRVAQHVGCAGSQSSHHEGARVLKQDAGQQAARDALLDSANSKRHLGETGCTKQKRCCRLMY